MKFRRKALLHGGPTDLELPISIHATVMREAEEVESLRLSSTVKASHVSARVPAEPNETCLLGMEFQRKLPKSVAQFSQKTPCLVSVLKTDDEIVGPANDDDISSGTLPP
jgi:hypothetical protein